MGEGQAKEPIKPSIDPVPDVMGTPEPYEHAGDGQPADADAGPLPTAPGAQPPSGNSTSPPGGPEPERDALGGILNAMVAAGLTREEEPSDIEPVEFTPVPPAEAPPAVVEPKPPQQAPPVVGAGGPAVMAPKGLGDLARYAIAATIVAALGLGAFIFMGNKGPAPVSTAVPSVTGTSGPAVTPGGSAAGPVVTAAPTAAVTAAPGAPVVIFTDMGESNAPTLDECQGSSGTYKDPRNRYSFTITVAELGNAQATQTYADRLLGRPAVLTLVGPPDEGVYTATIEQGFGGNLVLNFDGIECKPDGFSSLGSLTVEGLALELQANGLRMGPLPE